MEDSKYSEPSFTINLNYSPILIQTVAFMHLKFSSQFIGIYSFQGDIEVNYPKIETLH
jgi:hypothetical protein